MNTVRSALKRARAKVTTGAAADSEMAAMENEAEPVGDDDGRTTKSAKKTQK